jgi:hypothetical protein
LLADGCLSQRPKQALTLSVALGEKDHVHQRYFIRGYFDADGGISIYEKAHCQANISFVGTHDFLERLQEVLVTEADITANAIRSHAHYLSMRSTIISERWFKHRTVGGVTLEVVKRYVEMQKGK